MSSASDIQKSYWDRIARRYQSDTHIDTNEFHYGPLLAGDRAEKLLPAQLRGLRCLEVGCGGAQNSVYLSSRGACCTAVDISANQLAHAAACATDAGVHVELVEAPMEALADAVEGPFDLVHSVFGLPFCETPQGVVADMASLLRPGGTLLIATAHPLTAFEWFELEDEGTGTFVTDYFHPPLETREDEGHLISSHSYPVASGVEWIRAAGLTLTALREPRALPEDQLHLAPYRSLAWAEQWPRLRSLPVAVIYAAQK